MKQEEIDYIGNDLYKRTLNAKKNGEWTENDLKLETQLYKELNSLGFNFYWHMQLSPAVFTKNNKEIIEIFKKYYGKFNNEGLNDTCIYCLGVPGLYGATQFLLDEYDKYCGLSNLKLNSICNAIYRIRDPHHIKDYLRIISDNNTLTAETGLIVDLLGILKVKEALPRLIELLDCPILINDKDNNNFIYLDSILAIGKFKDPVNIKYIERFLIDPHPVARENAVKSIKKMGGKVEKIKDENGKNIFVLVKNN